ncbi:P-type conjugative transfer protein TrbG [Pasteurella multocida]|uniref:P-type conjugative transfer protein TrbG n=1 Tax=Pasteurella multocida TaxID=747 RepID=UPI0013F440C0|nr:P-type conjugative transfer protein TrbG [Pasteurella multocida]
MKKTLTLTLLSGLMITSHLAIAETFSKSEAKALQLSQKWRSGYASAQPGLSTNGSIQYVFGSSQPSIVTAIFQVTDIALQPGEQLNNINIGDKVRWSLEPTISGSGSNKQVHVIVKPLDTNLDTTLILSTDRRVYHLRLKSTAKKFVSSVSFVYPEDVNAQIQKLNADRQHHLDRTQLPDGSGSIDNLNFEYEISGSPSWKPIRVYDNGQQTTIQMPKRMNTGDAPALLVLKKPGGVFSKEQTAVVNYRVIDSKYIVDGIFDKVILVSGVGSSQERVTISKK